MKKLISKQKNIMKPFQNDNLIFLDEDLIKNSRLTPYQNCNINWKINLLLDEFSLNHEEDENSDELN